MTVIEDALAKSGAGAPTYSVAKPSRTRLATASMIGTTLEWYDFTVYNTLAALVFPKLFFPSVDPLIGVILAFSTYAVGYLSRPLGGVILGNLGDRRGRRAVLVLTLVLMGLATGLMGVLPTYAVLGVWSPVLLVALRFVQGVAIGGEWAGSVLLAVEHGDQRRRGLNASWTQVGPCFGIFLSTGLITLITYVMSPAAFLDWGWRLAFPFSLVIVAFGVWVRHGVGETPMFEHLKEAHTKVETPALDVFRYHWRRLLIAGGARMGVGVVFALAVVFSLTYVTTTLHLSRTLVLNAVMIGTACNAMTIPLFGALSDRIGRRPVYAGGAIAGAIWAFAFFNLLDSKEPVLIVVAIVLGLVIHASMYGPQASFITEQFPTQVRYAGSSLTYTFAGVFSDGFAPLIIVTLFKAAAGTWAISTYVTITLAMTLVALLVARETARKPLEE